jgi:hypothetical protein
VIDLADRADAESANEPGQLDELADTKQHGLGHLLNPTDPESESRDWISELWEYIVRTDALGQQAVEPKWQTGRRPAGLQAVLHPDETLMQYSHVAWGQEPETVLI